MRPLWSAAAICLAAAVACGPKRLPDLAHEGKDLTEAQIHARKMLKATQLLFEQGDLDRAAEGYLQALSTDPLLAAAHLGLADVYELSGDGISTLAEQIAYTETAKTKRLAVDRMADYLFAKFARNPSSKREVDDETQALALLELSRAVSAFRAGQAERALGLLEKARKGIPRAGVVDYLASHYHLSKGFGDMAAVAAVQAAGHNGFFARQALVDQLDRRMPNLLERLRDVLASEHVSHPSDAETSFVLGCIQLRLGRPAKALEVVKQALAWGAPQWELLFVKAAACHLQGDELAAGQALADLVDGDTDLSRAFSKARPSIFQGLLAGELDDFIAKQLAPRLSEPARSHFLWRMEAERGGQQVESLEKAFFEQVEQCYPAGSFDKLPGTAEPDGHPASLSEYMGFIQERIDEAMPAFWDCDRGRREKRAAPSGRLLARVELDRSGRVALTSIEENTTRDSVLAHCVLRKIYAMRFPRALRAWESFKLPVVFGPEVDGLREKSPQ
ncbi:MAG: tetratricopeptide repeat protein [Deltaproteobacteria bacterium]|nr:tetratricopeptide repeat protein [Deltaproteobacteria bacterium]